MYTYDLYSIVCFHSIDESIVLLLFAILFVYLNPNRNQS